MVYRLIAVLDELASFCMQSSLPACLDSDYARRLEKRSRESALSDERSSISCRHTASFPGVSRISARKAVPAGLCRFHRIAGVCVTAGDGRSSIAKWKASKNCVELVRTVLGHTRLIWCCVLPAH